MPEPVRGILWFGTDDAATSPLTPIYGSATEVPWCLSEQNGTMMEYSDTSMFWLTNRVTNFAYLRYDMISADIDKVLDKWENERLAEVEKIDKAAVELFAKRPKKGLEYLTSYSVNTAQTLFEKWSALDKYLLVKYIDGNVKKERGEGGFDGEGFLDNGNGANIPQSPNFPGYDERWYRNVVANDDGTLRAR